MQVLEVLIVIYRSKGDEQSFKRAEAEMEKVTTDMDREIATVKEFLTSLTLRASSMSDAEFQGDLLEEKAPKSNIPRGISVGQADKNLERIKWPKFHRDKAKFENFWAPFESIVDKTDEPAKYKIIRLK